MRTAIIPGVAGFIGSRLAAVFLEGQPDCRVVGIDAFRDYNSVERKRQRLAKLQSRPRFQLEELDLLARDPLPTEIDGASTIYHLAAQPGVRSSWGSQFETYVVDNVLATQRLLEAASQSSTLPNFVYASSSSVYADLATYPALEASPTRPVSPYGVTKLAGEHMTMLCGRTRSLPVASLRFHTVYGPGQRPDMAIHRIITSAITGEPFAMFGAASYARDFAYVDDIARGCLLAAHSPSAVGEVIDLAGVASADMASLIATIESLVGRSVHLQDRGTVPGDVRRTGGSIEKAHAPLCWNPGFSLEQGLQNQYEEIKRELRLP